MLCFSVESADSLENIETKWKKEIEENCPGVKIVLVALKCDLREAVDDEEENPNEPKRPLIDYQQGLRVAQNIKALRYLGESCEVWTEGRFGLTTGQECSAMKNRGVKEAFIEAARVAMAVKSPADKSRSKCVVM